MIQGRWLLCSCSCNVFLIVLTLWVTTDLCATCMQEQCVRERLAKNLRCQVQVPHSHQRSPLWTDRTCSLPRCECWYSVWFPWERSLGFWVNSYCGPTTGGKWDGSWFRQGAKEAFFPPHSSKRLFSCPIVTPALADESSVCTQVVPILWPNFFLRNKPDYDATRQDQLNLIGEIY